MGWSEWKNFGGESSGATIVKIGSFGETGDVSVYLSKSFDIASITDKYSELTAANFFVEVTSVSCNGGTKVSLSNVSKSYNAETGKLIVSTKLSNSGGNSSSYSCYIAGVVHMVY